jgi:phosphoribosyl-AMP cyclohydrolase
LPPSAAACDPCGREEYFAVTKTSSEIEDGTAFTPRFDADGLVPVVVTSATTGEVLMLAYMNDAAIARTLETGEAHYWSRSRQALWRKGEVSGNTQRVVEMRTDCDQDALWLKVEMGGAEACCHTGRKTCFYRAIFSGGGPAASVTLAFVAAERLFDPGDVYDHADAAKGTLKTSK